jgi:2-(1,2-epoxy-1,2-dihydrophenyl)acetyl-CoA isomerase
MGLVEVEADESVVTLVLTNPSKRNAIDDGLREDLLESLRRFTSASTVRAIVIAGKDGAFCAGGELRGMPTEPDRIAHRLGQMHDIIRLIHAGPKPVAVAVEGFAFGSGLSIATGADLVVAASDARFGCTFRNVGLIADTGLHSTLPLRVGWAAARRILLGGEVLDAAAALDLGLVDRLVNRGSVLSEARRAAQDWITVAPLALAATKQMNAYRLESCLEAELQAQTALLGSRDFAEGRLAFLEQRAPRFTGR